MMNETGIPVFRWIDGILEAKENLGQPNNTRAMVLWEGAPNSQTRQLDMKTAMGEVDLLVVVPIRTQQSLRSFTIVKTESISFQRPHSSKRRFRNGLKPLNPVA